MSEQNSVVNAEKGDGEISSNVETASSVNPSVKPQNAIKEEAKETNGEDQKCKGPENAGSTAETKETSNDATNGMKTPEETEDTNDKRHDDEGEDGDEDEDEDEDEDNGGRG
ncbi:Sec7p [Saccharomyces cerevisiae FostersO]|nr:Sec7p [Saccharomyces cerevisiae FostersO]